MEIKKIFLSYGIQMQSIMSFLIIKMQNENRIFTPIEFLEKFYSQSQNSESHLQENTQQKWGFQAFNIIPEFESCLEIGSGPVLNLAACASRKCKNIYLTDFNTDCFELTKKELNRNPGDKDAFWFQRFTVIANLQNIPVSDLMKRVQDRVVACFKCDMHKDELLEIPYFKKVDVITSSLAMESAAIDFDHYERILGNFKKYLNPKGYVYFYGTLEQSYYIVEGKKLPVLYLNEQKIRSALTKKDFQVIKFNKLLVAQSEQLTKNVSDAVGYYSVLAKLLD